MKLVEYLLKNLQVYSPKMYSYIKDNNQNSKTAEGIKKNIINNVIKHENYKDVLLNNKYYIK